MSYQDAWRIGGMPMPLKPQPAANGGIAGGDSGAQS